MYVLGLDQTGTGSSYLHVLNTNGVNATLIEASSPVLISEPPGEIPTGLAITY